jgi:hypothetical protein
MGSIADEDIILSVSITKVQETRPLPLVLMLEMSITNVKPETPPPVSHAIPLGRIAK